MSKATRRGQPRSVVFYAYLWGCRDGSYYAGHTDDIERRMADHSTGALGGYTASWREAARVEVNWRAWCVAFDRLRLSGRGRKR